MKQNYSEKDVIRDKAIIRQVHKLFFEANWQTKWYFLFGLITRTAAIICTAVLIPLAIAYGIEGITEHSLPKVQQQASWVLALGLVHGVLWVLSGHLVNRGGEIANEYLQHKVYQNFLSKDYDFYTSTYFGALGAQAIRLRETFSNDYSVLLFTMVPKQVVIVLGGIIVIAFASPILAGVTLLSMLVILSVTLGLARLRFKYRRQVVESGNEISGLVGDALTQATVVKSFATEEFEKERMKAPVTRLVRAMYKSWMIGAWADGGRMAIASVVTAVLLVATAQLYFDSTISIAIVALVQLYVIRLIAATVEISDMIKQYDAAMGNAYQAVKTMLVPANVTDTASPTPLPVGDQLTLELQGVTYQYEKTRAENAAVKDFSLVVRPGEKIGIVGYSGSGKTTLSRLLLRFMDVTQGSILLGDVDVRELRQADLRHYIAYVPQEPMLFHRSIRENIAYGDPKASKKRVGEAIEAAYVHEFAGELPNGYDTLVGERGIKLSGGQRQRVAIARALVKNAPLLVLDEATSALDSQSEQYIQKALWALMKNRTALVIAHRLSTIQRMDRIVVMDKGRIVEIGTHKELLERSNGIYATLWAHQSGGYFG